MGDARTNNFRQRAMSDADGFHPEYTKKFHIYSGPADEQFQACAIFSGNGNSALSAEICKFLGTELAPVTLKTFADGEVSVQLQQSVRGQHVFLIQSVCGDSERSVNDALVELLLMISACKRHNAAKISAVVPYYAYARQDRTMRSRVPISAADVAVMLSGMGLDHMLSVDLHCGQIQGFFPPTVPVDDLSAAPVGALYFSEKSLVKPVVVSPDAGGVARAKEFRSVLQEHLGIEVGIAIIIKQRSGASKIERMDLVGEVNGCDAIICDDICDTAGTLCTAAGELKKAGANRVYAFITHGLLSGPAAERVAASELTELVVTNTVPLPEAMRKLPNVTQLSLAPVLAEAMKAVYGSKPMTETFRPRL